MTVNLKPGNATVPMDERTDTPLQSATAITKNFFGSRTALALGVGTLGLILGLLIEGGGGTHSGLAAVPVATGTARLGTAPAACLEALDYADEAIGSAAKRFTIAGDYYSALAQGDFESAGDSAGRLTIITGHLTRLTTGFQVAKASCR